MELKNQEGARRVGPAADLDSEGDGSMGFAELRRRSGAGAGSRPENPNPVMKNGKKPQSGAEGSPSLSFLAADLVAGIAVSVGAVETTVLVDEPTVNGQTLVVLRIRGFRREGVGGAEYDPPTHHSTQGG